MLNKIKESIKYRHSLCEINGQIVRLCSGAPDLLPGLIIDQYGDLVVVALYNSSLLASEELVGYCKELFKDQYYIIRCRNNSLDNSYSYYYSHTQFPPALVAVENMVKYEIHFDVKHDFGLFRDASGARKKLSEVSAGKSLLNLFAYTCGFGVTAKVFGANSVTNVDPSKDYLTWGKRNCLLNETDFAVVPDTAQKYLGRQVNKFRKSGITPFDIIISDPPAFGVGRGSDRTLRTYWELMVEQIGELAPSEIFLLCNDRSVNGSKLFMELIGQKLADYHFEILPHLADVAGQFTNHADPWYLLPATIYLKKKST